MTVELVADCRTHGSRAATVDDADVREPCERRVVDERANRLARLVRASAANVELVRHVRACARHDPDRWSTRLVRIRGARIGTQPRKGDANALAAHADDL